MAAEAAAAAAGGGGSAAAVVGYLRTSGVVYELEDAETTIGRSPDSDICLRSSKSISSRHAKLVVQDPARRKAFLQDTGSMNGCFVNDQRIQGNSIELASGDLIKFGYDTASFRFEFPADHRKPVPVDESKRAAHLKESKEDPQSFRREAARRQSQDMNMLPERARDGSRFGTRPNTASSSRGRSSSPGGKQSSRPRSASSKRRSSKSPAVPRTRLRDRVQAQGTRPDSGEAEMRFPGASGAVSRPVSSEGRKLHPDSGNVRIGKAPDAALQRGAATASGTAGSGNSSGNGSGSGAGTGAGSNAQAQDVTAWEQMEVDDIRDMDVDVDARPGDQSMPSLAQMAKSGAPPPSKAKKAAAAAARAARASSTPQPSPLPPVEGHDMTAAAAEDPLAAVRPVAAPTRPNHPPPPTDAAKTAGSGGGRPKPVSRRPTASGAPAPATAAPQDGHASSSAGQAMMMSGAPRREAASHAGSVPDPTPGIASVGHESPMMHGGPTEASAAPVKSRAPPAYHQPAGPGGGAAGGITMPAERGYEKALPNPLLEPVQEDQYIPPPPPREPGMAPLHKGGYDPARRPAYETRGSPQFKAAGPAMDHHDYDMHSVVPDANLDSMDVDGRDGASMNDVQWDRSELEASLYAAQAAAAQKEQARADVLQKQTRQARRAAAFLVRQLLRTHLQDALRRAWGKWSAQVLKEQAITAKNHETAMGVTLEDAAGKLKSLMNNDWARELVRQQNEITRMQAEMKSMEERIARERMDYAMTASGARTAGAQLVQERAAADEDMVFPTSLHPQSSAHAKRLVDAAVAEAVASAQHGWESERSSLLSMVAERDRQVHRMIRATAVVAQAGGDKKRQEAAKILVQELQLLQQRDRDRMLASQRHAPGAPSMQ